MVSPTVLGPFVEGLIVQSDVIKSSPHKTAFFWISALTDCRPFSIADIVLHPVLRSEPL